MKFVSKSRNYIFEIVKSFINPNLIFNGKSLNDNNVSEVLYGCWKNGLYSNMFYEYPFLEELIGYGSPGIVEYCLENGAISIHSTRELEQVLKLEVIES